MSDALSRLRLVELLNGFLRWLPNAVKILPNTAYRRHPPFRSEDRDTAAAIVAGVAAFLPGDAVLIQRAMDRFYGTIDRASIPPSENAAYVLVVLNPLRRYARALETTLTKVRDSVAESGRVARPESSMGVACVRRLTNHAHRKASGRATRSAQQKGEMK
jgi:hypothetical protein